MTTEKTIYALFETPHEANLAMHGLRDLGFREENMELGAGSGALEVTPIESLFRNTLPEEIPAHKRGFYEESLRRGNAVVTIQTEEAALELARKTLMSYGAFDVGDSETPGAQGATGRLPETRGAHGNHDSPRNPSSDGR